MRGASRMSSRGFHGRTSGGGGRGAYYKAKYGRGGRGRATRGDDDNASSSSVRQEAHPTGGGTFAELCQLLQRIDGKQYPFYHDLETTYKEAGTKEDKRCWVHSQFTLQIARAQADPFAPPTRCRVITRVPNLPQSAFENKIRRIATADYFLRRLYSLCQSRGYNESLKTRQVGTEPISSTTWNGPKGGDIQIMEPSQYVLEQSGVQVDSQGQVQIQLSINLPARGRTILGHEALRIFEQSLPNLVQNLLDCNFNELVMHVDSVDDQVWLQSQLKTHGLVAFVRDGAVLPRASGADDRPLLDGLPFQSPSSLRCSFTLPRSNQLISGMGLKTGISLICGGGFHGKSTLLDAIQTGIYPKIPGDGREFCVTIPNACKIRAEDGRHVSHVDISPFIRNLPFGKDTGSFSTTNASGSTSQASNIVENIELGSELLLLDEDTCASNFMFRDAIMQQLVRNENEPITPFLETVRSLYEELGVSTILVVGGVGEFFNVADRILLMNEYTCSDATQQAKEAGKKSTNNFQNAGAIKDVISRMSGTVGSSRTVRCPALFTQGKVKTSSLSKIQYGNVDLDLGQVEHLVSVGQTRAIAFSLMRMSSSPGEGSLLQMLKNLDQEIEMHGLDTISSDKFAFVGDVCRFRIFELGAAINRLRLPSLFRTTQGK